MNNVCLMYESALPYEYEVERRWWSLPLKTLLPLQDGERCQLLFAGRPGGSAGPDVRDAVLALVNNAGQQQKRWVGDVEFHVRSSDWVAHQHDRDPGYNHVILHVVLLCDDLLPTRRQDGTSIPLCSLYDLPDTSWPVPPEGERWPCQELSPSDQGHFARLQVLRQAGLLRFEQKTQAFVDLLRPAQEQISLAPKDGWQYYDRCLLPALAEGLGYGRDRAFFRNAGLLLLDTIECAGGSVPEPADRSLRPAPVDAERLRILSRLAALWRDPGIWLTLQQRLAAPASYSNIDLLSAVRRAFGDLGLSLARTDILIVNVVLPFATAVALLEQNKALAERAQGLYLEHPGLPSNRITRAMCAQLQWVREPQGSCQQQGLQYIYQQTCREKHCAVCMMGRNIL